MTIYDTLKTATTPLMAKFKNPVQATWERVTRTPNGSGGFTEAWASQGTVNIIILPNSPSEPFMAGRLQSEIQQIIYVLYDDASGITSKDRIVFNSRIFNIEGAINIAEGNMWLKLICKEGVAT